MARVRVDVLLRDGAGIRLLRDEDGLLWSIHPARSDAVARWLGTLDGVVLWGSAWMGDAGPTLEAVWLDRAAVDEVELPVGPDRDALGIFDTPTTGTATGEDTEGPSSEAQRAGGGQRRTAVLAWIAAQDLGDDDGEDGPPCAALKRLIADEPLDLVPALDGLLPRPPLLRPVALERDDTATQIRGFEQMIQESVSEGDTSPDDVRASAGRGPRSGFPSPRVLLFVALGATITAWLLQFAR